MTYFNPDDSLYSITERFPAAIPVFTANGFPQMGDPESRSLFGKNISLKTALMMKKLDPEVFTSLLNEAVNLNSGRAPDDAGSNSEAVKVTGLLPCPVRLPVLEEFTAFADSYLKSSGTVIDHRLQAASMGLEWMEDELKEITDPRQLPDIFISAGFDFFFDEKKIGRFKNMGVFSDCTGVNEYNSLFSGLDLKDPRGHYSIISAVPAVFLVNPDELGSTPEPESWEDILKPEFENRVSIPTGDFDLFNAILLNIYKKYGGRGVESLGKSLLESMHPSQMVKSGRKKEGRPAVTILPYFFTKTIFSSGGMKPIWPSDGAVLSPIFLLSKTGSLEKIKPVVDFFASPLIGNILAHKGLFPSTHPAVDNRIDGTPGFMWLGWDYIYANDIGGLIKKCENIFASAGNEGAA